jgi:DNA invertase Pin-like site-specific DNA recombinase
MPDPLRAVGLIRVSRVGDRKGDRFVSPKDQRHRIERFADQEGIELLDIYEELDVSGGWPIDQRPGLRRILGEIEARHRGANSLIVGYFDRLGRSTDTGQEVMRRLAVAHGHLFVAEEGEQRVDTPDAWFIFTIKMATAELYRRQTAVRVRAAKVRSIERGVAPFPSLIAGYLKTADGTITVDPVLAPVVRRAYEMRVEGSTWNEIRAHLRGHGIRRCLRGTVRLLSSRMVLGELHSGELKNEKSHEPIVERVLWDRVQKMQKIRGRSSNQQRLLARLGLLRCGMCQTPMIVGGQVQKRRAGNKIYPDYRCQGRAAGVDCPRGMHMLAEPLERIVKDQLFEDLGKRTGALDIEETISALRIELEAAEAERDNVIALLAGYENLHAARARLDTAQAKVDEIAARYDAARQAADPIFTLYADRSEDEFEFHELRALLRASFVSIAIVPGRGRERVLFVSTGRQTLVE